MTLVTNWTSKPNTKVLEIKKPIEFINVLDYKGEWTKCCMEPSEYDFVECIIHEPYGPDIFLAWNKGSREPSVYTGHYNEGTV